MLQTNRRSFLVGVTAASAITALPRCSSAQVQGPFKLDPLPYAYNALEPSIDKRTMELHHDIHHGAAVTALNAAVKDHPEVSRMRLEVMLIKLGELPEEIRTGGAEQSAAATPTTLCSGKSWAKAADNRTPS